MRSRRSRWISSAVLCIGLVAFASRSADAGDSDADDFRQNCASCHTIGGGRLVGPDLKGATTRRPREWLVRFLQDPKAVIDSGDVYALKLFEDSRRVLMPTVAGMNAKRADALLTLIEEESKLEKSRFATSGVSDRAFLPDDVRIGRELFLGTRPLAAGGPACIACHMAGDTGGLGGGRLGPDLTQVFSRLEGRKALGAWLMAPPTATMKPLWSGRALDPDAEILPLLAFLQDADQRRDPPNVTAVRLTYVLLAAALAALSLAVAQRAWRGRFRGVRAALVKGDA
jgi:mono/diheme cytochrome c family protein